MISISGFGYTRNIDKYGHSMIWIGAPPFCYTFKNSRDKGTFNSTFVLFRAERKGTVNWDE